MFSPGRSVSKALTSEARRKPCSHVFTRPKRERGSEKASLTLQPGENMHRHLTIDQFDCFAVVT